MREPLTVLVLGVGGNVSQGILKAIALSGVPCHFIGSCISPLAFGLYLFDRAYVSPLAVDPNFLDGLMTICATEVVDAIFSGSQLLALGIMGEYMARIHFCTMNKPSYVVRLQNDKSIPLDKPEE